MNQGFNQIEFLTDDRKKTPCVTEEVSYQFLTKPIGMKANPLAFQRAMNLTLGSLKRKMCIVFIDDVSVYSKTFEEHLEQMDLVLQHLLDAE